MSKAITLSKLPSGIAVLTIDLPDSKLNFLSGSVMEEINGALDTIESEKAPGVIVVSGKEDNFGAGADVKEIQALQAQPAIEIYNASKMGKQVFARFEKLNSIAAIHGSSRGGFTELAIACKYRIATADPATTIGVPEVQLGFLPGWGGTVRLPKLIGLASCLLPERLPNGWKLEFGWGGLTSGEAADAHQAWRIGMVDETVERAGLVNRAEQILLGAKPKRYALSVKARSQRAFLATSLGRSIVSKMALAGVMQATKGKYPAPVEIVKVASVAAAGGDLTKAYEMESQSFAKLATTQVSRNLVGIFFGQSECKKMPEGIKPNLTVKKLGVLGAGVMGAGIAQTAAYKGFQVVLKDINQEALDKGMASIRGLFDGLVKKKKLSRTEADVMLSAIKPTLDYVDLADCDLVIEAVVEKMPVKKIVRSDSEKAIAKLFGFGSNTSSLEIDDMPNEFVNDKGVLVAAASRAPEMVVGIHFFNPVHKMKLVEVVKGRRTADETVAMAKEFVAALGKFPLGTADRPLFVVNRILAPYMRAAIVMAEEGVPIVDIEKAAINFGMMGPFSLLDDVGLDIASEVIHVAHKAFGDRLSPPAIINLIKEKKLLGRKGGTGIYLYDGADGERKFVMEGKTMFKKGKKRYLLNPEVTEALPKEVVRKTEGEIQDRLFLAMVAEAARTIEEKVIEQPALLDFAMVYGTGFPPFLGGPLAYADQLGLPLLVQKLDYLSQVAGDNYKPCQLLRDMAKSGRTFRG